MKIAETFYSIQGEGMLLGVPSFFIRTSGCNLRCGWCDTPYTSWEPEGVDRSIGSLMEEARPYKNIVVTGGEPMIAPGIAELTNGLRAAGAHITIETAGTTYAPVACDLMSISPKLANSTPEGTFAAQHERLRYQPDVLRKIINSFPEYQLKFVVVSPADLDEIESMRGEIGAGAARVVLMPEGIKRETVQARSVWLSEICKERGFRFSPRLHIDIWGDKRGV